MNILNKLKEYDDLYYNFGTSPISDTEYDKIKEEAKKQFPNDPYFKSVGAKVKTNKVKLPYTLGSLEKKKPDTIDNWIKDKNRFVIMDKLDGMSIFVRFDKGNLVFAATRGDGEEGQDITEKVKFIKPKIKFDGFFEARGEIMLLGDDYKSLGFKNRRNGIVGIINRDNINLLKYAKIIFYEVFNPRFDSVIDQLNFLQSIGLKIPNYAFTNKVDKNELIKFHKEFKEEANGYDIDGLVITIDDYIREDIDRPINKIAFKVNEDAQKTKVIGIEWEISRTGKIIPVIQIEPLEINGTTVQRASGFNAKYIKENNIGINAEVGILKSGEIIPFITEVFKEGKLDLPEKCPNCKQNLIWDGVDLICTNNNCAIYKKLSYFLRILGAENITEKTLEKLKLDSLIKIYDVNEFEISIFDGFGLKRGEDIVTEIQKTLETTPEKLLTAFGISNIGKEISSLILQYINFDDLFKLTPKMISKLNEVKGLGDKKIKNLVNNIKNYESTYKYLLCIGLKFKIKKQNKNISNKIITLTGNGSLSREKYIEKIEENNGFVKGISKKTSFLVAENLNGNSNKIKLAKKYNIKIISYSDLDKILEI